MADRNFLDKQGRKWEIRVRSKSEWDLVPAADNRERPRSIRPPGYEPDPFEMSVEELQRLLDEPDQIGRSKSPKSPFKD